MIPQMNDDTFSQNNPKAFKNPWVLGWIALVIIVLAVNIGFISLAFITNPGLVDKNYYDNAQDYEENLIKYRNARAALGWTYQADYPPKPLMQQKNLYQLTLVDKAGLPLVDAEIKIIAYRPSDANADFETHLKAMGNGIYQGRLTYPLKGIWEITTKIKHNNDSYDFTRRASVAIQ